MLVESNRASHRIPPLFIAVQAKIRQMSLVRLKLLQTSPYGQNQRGGATIPSMTLVCAKLQ